MSITHVQGTGNANTSVSTAITATLSGVTAGDTLIVVAIGWSSALVNAILSVGDSQGNTYSTDVTATQTFGKFSHSSAYIFRTVVPTSGSVTITLTANIPVLLTCSLDEYSSTFGLLLDTTANNTASTTGLTTNSMSLTSTDLVVAGWDIRITGLTYTVGSGFTLGFTENSASSEAFLSEYNVSQSVSPVTPNAVISSPAEWLGVSAAYYENVLLDIYGSDLGSSQEVPELFGLTSDLFTGSESLISERLFYDLFTSQNQQIQSMVNLDSIYSSFDNQFALHLVSFGENYSALDIMLRDIFLAEHASSADTSFFFNTIYFVDIFMSQDISGQAVLPGGEEPISEDSFSLSNSIYSYDLFHQSDIGYPISSLIMCESYSNSEAFYATVLPTLVEQSDIISVSESLLISLNMPDPTIETELNYILDFIYMADTSQVEEF